MDLKTRGKGEECSNCLFEVITDRKCGLMKTIICKNNWCDIYKKGITRERESKRKIKTTTERVFCLYCRKELTNDNQIQICAFCQTELVNSPRNFHWILTFNSYTIRKCPNYHDNWFEIDFDEHGQAQKVVYFANKVMIHIIGFHLKPTCLSCKKYSTCNNEWDYVTTEELMIGKDDGFCYPCYEDKVKGTEANEGEEEVEQCQNCLQWFGGTLGEDLCADCFAENM